MKATSTFSGRVRFSELDPQGVVFYSRYLEYADAAIVEYLRCQGVSSEVDEYSHDFQVKKVAAEFFRPLRQSAEFEVTVGVKKLGTSSVSFSVSVIDSRSQEQCCALELLQVYVRLSTVTAVPIPNPLRDRLAAE